MKGRRVLEQLFSRRAAACNLEKTTERGFGVLMTKQRAPLTFDVCQVVLLTCLRMPLLAAGTYDPSISASTRRQPDNDGLMTLGRDACGERVASYSTRRERWGASGPVGCPVSPGVNVRGVSSK